MNHDDLIQNLMSSIDTQQEAVEILKEYKDNIVSNSKEYEKMVEKKYELDDTLLNIIDANLNQKALEEHRLIDANLTKNAIEGYRKKLDSLKADTIFINNRALNMSLISVNRQISLARKQEEYLISRLHEAMSERDKQTVYNKKHTVASPMELMLGFVGRVVDTCKDRPDAEYILKKLYLETEKIQSEFSEYINKKSSS